MNKDRINPFFQEFPVDYLYHLGIDTTMDISSVFGNIKYVIFTLSNAEAKVLVNEFARDIYCIPEENFSYEPIYKTERFHMYKVGVTIIISGGVGIQSLLICINEVTKLMVHLKKYDVCYFKIGLSASLGVPDGDIIISNQVANSTFTKTFKSIECGTTYEYPTILNDKMAKSFLKFSKTHGFTNVHSGINLSAHNFTDMQIIMRNNLIYDDITSKNKLYLSKAYDLGIRSIDMESLSFTGFCAWLDIQACVVNISIVDFLVHQKITTTMDTQLKMLAHFAPVLVAYIQKSGGLIKQLMGHFNKHQINSYKIYQPHLLSTNVKADYLYSLKVPIDNKTIDNFRGIKYICMQGSSDRTKTLAKKLAQLTLGIEEIFFTPHNLFKNAFFKGYRIGNILCVSHGMGALSVVTLLHDITRLMQASGNTDLEYIRIGTSGGINIEPGSIVITNTAFDHGLNPGCKMPIENNEVTVPTHMDNKLSYRILQAQPEMLPFKLVYGNTIAADDFYLGQCRFDGAIKPRYDKEMQQEFFKKIMEKDIYNFEMESVALASFCARAHIPAAMIAVTILDRLHGDQVTSTSEELAIFSDRTHTVVIAYLLSQMDIKKSS